MCFKLNVFSFGSTCCTAFSKLEPVFNEADPLRLSRPVKRALLRAISSHEQTEGPTSCSCLSLPFPLFTLPIRLGQIFLAPSDWDASESKTRVKCPHFTTMCVLLQKPGRCCNHRWCRDRFVSDTDTFSPCTRWLILHWHW